MYRYLIPLALAVVLTGCSQPEEAPQQSVRPITWIRVVPSSFEQIRRLSGTIEPVESTDLSFEVGGRIESIAVNLGDQIRKGQVIAQLDKRTYSLSLQSAEANLQQAQSTFVEAQNEFTRYEELIEKGLVSRSGFDNVKATYESAVSAVNIAKAQLDIARKDLADTELRAPYDGQITKRLAEPSMQITPGQPIFEVEGEDGLEVSVMVPETLIAQIDKGNDLKVSFPVQPGITRNGVITEIGTRAETANAFPVTVLIDSPMAQLRAGMTAEVDFVFDGVGRTGFQGEVFRVPISAILAYTNQEAYAFVYDEESSQVTRTRIQTENILNNEVYVSSGLTEGQIIATAGITFLQDGQTVRLVDKHISEYNN